MDTIRKVKKVAVVAVHGVGDQMPFETAHRIGDLLQDLNIGDPPGGPLPTPASSQSPVYYPFREQTLRLDVRPTVVRPAAQGKQLLETDARLQESRGPFNTWAKDCLRRGETIEDDEIWYQFTRGQLVGYQGDDPEDTYQTVRMEGSRAPQDGQDQFDVHIYEVYWADLSRLKAGVFSIFTELYQLLFHLPSLGTATVNAAALHHRSSGWRMFRNLQTYTAGILTVPIPILNLFLLGTIAIVVTLNALRNANAEVVLSAGTLGMALIGGSGWLFWRRLGNRPIRTWVWLSPLPVIGAIVAIVMKHSVSRAVQQKWASSAQISACCIVAIIVAFLLFLILRIYDLRRPGVLKWAGILGLLVFAAGVGSVYFLSPNPDQLQQGILFWVRQFEICDTALLLAWGLFFLTGLGSFVTGGVAVAGTRTDKLSHRSWWTGLLMLSLPALVFLIVTVGAWYLVADLIPRYLPDANYHALWVRFGVRSVKQIPSTLQAHLGIVFKTLMVGAVASVAFAIWGLAPVVWTEVFPVKSSPQSRAADSSRLGRWLTLGFHGLLVSGVILYAATMIVLPGISVLSLFYQKSKFLYVYASFAAVSGTAFAALFLVRGRLKKLVLGFRPILDMLLDVDNWFREHPLASNPKARICGRYVSILRYICNWREYPAKDDSGYDGIVIIAHSQGTVITAGLLRFLKKESQDNFPDYDPELAKLNGIPIYLFTMGCPLRQLYGLRFPHLYHWARHDDQSVMNPWKHGDIPKNQMPDPGELLGVSLWVNCYRSGDYVGRYLWRTDSCDYLWTGDCCAHPPALATEYNSTDEVQRLEFCIGAGAHTHYWDRTAGIVAKELDRLISTMGSGGGD